MITNKTLELMRELTQVIAVSGNEIKISKILQNYYREYTDEIVYDNLGSVYGVKKSKKPNAPKVMISSHMDEVGFIVKDFTKNGLIKVLSLGSACKQGLLGQRVRVMTNDGEEYKGTIVAKSNNDKDKVLDADKILIDIGASSREDFSSLGIKLGDSIVIDGSFEVLATGKRIMSKAWNSRYGCVLGIEILEALKDVELDVDLYVGCTVQHEVGLRGSQTATNLISPDLAIVLDCLTADDISGEELDVDLYVGCTVQHEVGLRGSQTATNLISPDLAIVLDCLTADDISGDSDAVGKLGEGVLINFYDKSMMPNRALLNHLMTTCKNNGISHQFYYSMSDGDGGWIHKLLRGCPTLSMSDGDGGWIHKLLRGCPTLNACICARNVENNSSIIDVNDYLGAREAVTKVIKSLNTEMIEMFKTENR